MHGKVNVQHGRRGMKGEAYEGRSKKNKVDGELQQGDNQGIRGGSDRAADRGGEDRDHVRSGDGGEAAERSVRTGAL